MTKGARRTGAVVAAANFLPVAYLSVLSDYVALPPLPERFLGVGSAIEFVLSLPLGRLAVPLLSPLSAGPYAKAGLYAGVLLVNALLWGTAAAWAVQLCTGRAPAMDNEAATG
jgi:hypothetical protein